MRVGIANGLLQFRFGSLLRSLLSHHYSGNFATDEGWLSRSALVAAFAQSVATISALPQIVARNAGRADNYCLLIGRRRHHRVIANEIRSLAMLDDPWKPIHVGRAELCALAVALGAFLLLAWAAWQVMA